MSSGLDLTPTELDRLEDALEDLELAMAPGELGVDDPVAQRLSEYREIMRIGREAMPLEEVPVGLLDGVIAQARQAAAAAPAAAAEPSFWARWRLGVWVPTLAFAGSAALLLLVLVPERDEEAAVASAERSGAAANEQAPAAEAKPPADGRLALAEPAREQAEQAEQGFEGGDAIRGGGVAIGERAPEPAAMPVEEEQAAADELEPEPEAAQRRKTAATGVPMGGAGTKGAAGAKPAPPAPASKHDAPKDAKEKKTKSEAGGDAWSELARADDDRRGGSCGLAKMRYDKLRKADDARVHARALAGLGLCAAASDDMATAKKLFAQARAADSGVSSFIDGELARLEGARTKAANVDQAVRE